MQRCPYYFLDEPLDPSDSAFVEKAMSERLGEPIELVPRRIPWVLSVGGGKKAAVTSVKRLLLRAGVTGERDRRILMVFPADQKLAAALLSAVDELVGQFVYGVFRWANKANGAEPIDAVVMDFEGTWNDVRKTLKAKVAGLPPAERRTFQRNLGLALDRLENADTREERGAARTALEALTGEILTPGKHVLRRDGALENQE